MSAEARLSGVVDVCRAVFAVEYAPVTAAAVRRAAVWALRHETYNPHHDVLMEDLGDGLVRLLPATCTPYHWRTWWRKKAAPQEDEA